jgi:hypothetical protein
MTAQAVPSPATGLLKVLVPVAVGAAVSVALGVYAKVHDPTGIAVSIPGFSGPVAFKVWLASAAAALGVVQLVSALALFGHLPGVTAPSWTGTLHRWSGRAAFLLSIPVAVHCLYAFGFESYDTRTLLHSLLGCVFYGAFTAKMLLLTRRGIGGWTLGLAGGLVFAALTGLWLTSSLWFFTTVGVKL